MHHWFKTILLAEVETWEVRLFNLGLTNVTITDDCRLDGYFRSEQEAREFAEEFGGEIQVLADENWVALGLRANSGRFLEILDRLVIALDDDPDFWISSAFGFPAGICCDFRQV